MKSLRRVACPRIALAIAAVWASFFASVVAFAAAPAMPSQKDMQELVAHRQQIILKLLKLDPGQQAAFDPLFAEYERERSSLGMERNELAGDLSKPPLSLSAEQADTLLDRFQTLRRQRVELDERFRPRLEAAISPQKTLLLFQLNFILDAVVNYDLAAMLPLAR